MKRYTEKQLIDYMEKATGVKNGMVAYDDEGTPVCYMSKEENGPVFNIEINNGKIEWIKL